MAKLIALAFAFTALVAFATAHTTIITTTINDDNPASEQRQCSKQLQGQNLNQCRTYLQQGQSRYNPQKEQQQMIQECCRQLQNVDEQCQCEAVKKVFQDVQKQQQGRGGQYGADQQTRQLKQQAQMIPNLCELRSRDECQIGSIMTTTTTVSNDIPFWSFGSQCSQSEIQQPVNQCKNYVEQQIWSPRTLLRMSINRQGQQQDQSLQQCCNKLQNVKRDCQCEAIKEVAKEVMQQQQQQGGRQYGRQQQDVAQKVRSVIQNLPDQCELDIQQCNIPYEGMF